MENYDDDDLLINNIPLEELDQNLTNFEISFFELSQDCPFQDINLEDNIDDECINEDYHSKSACITGDNFLAIQNRFIEFIKTKEMALYNETFVEQYFVSYDSSSDEIIQRTRTQLWMENCIYGIQFQAYLCMVKDIPLPIVPQRNRKQPILEKPDTSRRKGPNNDVIMETLLNSCKQGKQIAVAKHRQAPRNQIGMLIFLLDILSHPYYRNCIKWEDKPSLTFKILNSKLVAYYWMIVKENDTCNFENFARGIRYLRHSGIFKQIDKKRQKTYQFNKKAIKIYKNKRFNNQLSDILLRNLTNYDICSPN